MDCNSKYALELIERIENLRADIENYEKLGIKFDHEFIKCPECLYNHLCNIHKICSHCGHEIKTNRKGVKK